MTLRCYNLVQTIQGITRVAKRGDNFTQTTIDVIFTYCNQDVNQIEREIRSNGAFRSNRQFRSYISVSLCYDFRAIHISKS